MNKFFILCFWRLQNMSANSCAINIRTIHIRMELEARGLVLNKRIQKHASAKCVPFDEFIGNPSIYGYRWCVSRVCCKRIHSHICVWFFLTCKYTNMSTESEQRENAYRTMSNLRLHEIWFYVRYSKYQSDVHWLRLRYLHRDQKEKKKELRCMADGCWTSINGVNEKTIKCIRVIHIFQFHLHGLIRVY